MPSVNRVAFIRAVPGTKRYILFLNDNGINIRLFIIDLKHYLQQSERRYAPPFTEENCFVVLPVVNWNKILNACWFSTGLVFEYLENRVVVYFLSGNQNL